MESIQPTLFAQTLRLGFRVAVVWAGGFVIAVAVRMLLPDGAGFTFTGKQSTQFVSYSRIGFWTCVLAALAASGVAVVREMLVDFGLRAPR